MNDEIFDKFLLLLMPPTANIAIIKRKPENDSWRNEPITTQVKVILVRRPL
ncbi:hypothetical protein ACJJI3_09015 [Microbulbifer sp. ZKSA004]|uniref:hypothetical protein n=1 Tax=Microbulbifer sp. ZKSA004 TaxID=3243389 RepID=UPI00403A3277